VDKRPRSGRLAEGRVAFLMQTGGCARDHAARCGAGVAGEEPPRHEPYGTVEVWQDSFANRWDLIQFHAHAPTRPDPH